MFVILLYEFKSKEGERMSNFESREDYLETIYILSKKGKVRAIDIVNEMHYSKPSVSIAMKKLKEEGYIEISDNYITLTSNGLDIASKVYERHEILAKALVLLGVNEETALIDACKIEHDLSEESFIAIKSHLEKFNK